MSKSGMEEIIELYGQDAWDLILTVYVNFYSSELEIIDLCGRWIHWRSDLREKRFLLQHAADEIVHAGLFKEGVERLGLPWSEVNQEKYQIKDIDDRFQKLHESDDELEVLIGLNLYAEGVLAMEELHQLGHNKPQYFYQFDRIEREERRHVGFGITVGKRIISESDDNRRRAVEYCKWYKQHLDNYLEGQLHTAISWGIGAGFVSGDYIPRTRERFNKIMSELDILEA